MEEIRNLTQLELPGMPPRPSNDDAGTPPAEVLMSRIGALLTLYKCCEQLQTLRDVVAQSNSATPEMVVLIASAFGAMVSHTLNTLDLAKTSLHTCMALPTTTPSLGSAYIALDMELCGMRDALHLGRLP